MYNSVRRLNILLEDSVLSFTEQYFECFSLAFVGCNGKNIYPRRKSFDHQIFFTCTLSDSTSVYGYQINF